MCHPIRLKSEQEDFMRYIDWFQAIDLFIACFTILKTVLMLLGKKRRYNHEFLDM